MSSSRIGMVIGSRPVGSRSPSSTDASAGASSSPGNQVISTAAARSAHGMCTAREALTTTTVRGFAAVTLLDEFDLVVAQCHGVPISALPGRSLMIPDHQDDGIGGCGQLDRLLQHVLRVAAAARWR